MAGQPEVYDAVARRFGIVQVTDQEELLDACRSLSTNQPLHGTNVAAVSYSGGSGVWMADALERAGFSLPELDAGRQAAIRELLPDFASTRNPVDVTAASKVGLAKVMREIADAPYVDALVFITAMNSALIAGREIDDLRVLASHTRKPIVLFSYNVDPDPLAVRICLDLGLPVYPSSARAAAALKALLTVGRARAQEPLTPLASSPSPVADWPAGDERGRVPEYQSTALMKSLGFEVAEGVLALSEEEAIDAALAIGGPVAMKLQAPSLVHKASVGGVLLDVRGSDAIREGFRRLMEMAGAEAADKHGVLVQAMISGGLEMLVGVDNKSGFGPMMMVGFGGPHAEALRDVAVEMAPLTVEQAKLMIGSLRLYPLLSGVVDGRKYHTDGLAALLATLSTWATAHADHLDELDLNPVMIDEHAVTIVDSLLIRRS
jgi:acyl-CoA synthetase (NDP forming)